MQARDYRSREALEHLATAVLRRLPGLEHLRSVEIVREGDSWTIGQTDPDLDEKTRANALHALGIWQDRFRMI